MSANMIAATCGTQGTARRGPAMQSLPRVSAMEDARTIGHATVCVLQPPAAAATDGFIDLRNAVASDDRERQLTNAISRLRHAMQRGESVEISWPADRDLKFATATLAAPLASVVANLVHGSRGTVVIHTRTGIPADFLALPCHGQISFVVHVNSEEAAMRWERNDAEPGRRIAAAARLQAAGWNVSVCVGPARCFTGWREEYADLVDQLAHAGFDRLLLSFAGADAMHVSATSDTEDLDVLRAERGYSFGITDRKQKEVHAFLSGCLAARLRRTLPFNTRALPAAA